MYRPLSSATEWYPNGLIRGPILRAVVFDHYLHGLLFKGITFLESHLFSAELSIPLLSQSAPLHRFYGDLRAATQQQAERLTFTSADGCSSKSRAWFSLLCPATAFLLFPLLLRKDFPVVRNVNCENSGAFIRQTIRYASINPYYEFAQSLLLNPYLAPWSKSYFFVRETERTLHLFLQTFSPLLVFLSSLSIQLLFNFSFYFLSFLNFSCIKYKSRYKSFSLMSFIEIIWIND